MTCFVKGEKPVKIDAELIKYLEDLSCLSLSDSEKVCMEEELGKILTGMAKLSELDTAGVPECSHPFDHVNVFREDKVCASFDRKYILENAPDRTDEMFIAPKTVE